MKQVLVGLVLMLGATTMRAQQAVPEIPFDSVPNAVKLPPDLNFGEDAGVAVNSKGHVFVYTRSNSAIGRRLPRRGIAVARVRSDRQVRARDRQGPLRLVVRARGPRGQGRQHLGHRQRLGHGDQVQPGGPRGDGVRPEEGSLRRGGRAVGAHTNPPLPPIDGQLPPADRRRVERRTATSSSATATSTRASRSTTRTATG